MLKWWIQDLGVLQRLFGIARRGANLPVELFQEAGKLMMRSTIQTFDEGGRPTPWAPTIRGNAPPLTGSGKLKASGLVASVDQRHVEVQWGDDLPYRFLHFFGGKIPKEPGDPYGFGPRGRMRRYFWAKWFESDRTDEIWFNMAISRKPQFEMPQRKYLLFQEQDVTDIESLVDRFVKTGAMIQ